MTTKARDLAEFAADVPETLGTAGQALKINAGGTAYEWGTIATGADDVVFPSDFTSPSSTYNSSGTWSKGSLADTDYVWFYILNSGGGGGLYSDPRGGSGGRAMLLYGSAGTFDGATYVVAASKAGQTSEQTENPQNESSITLSSSNGSIVYKPNNISTGDDYSGTAANTNFQVATSGTTSTYIKATKAQSHQVFTQTLPSGYGQFTVSNTANGYFSQDMDCVFGGGVGSWPAFQSGYPNATSLFAGAGGNTSSPNGVFPGGGGSGMTSGQGGTGAAGQIRVYHV